MPFVGGGAVSPCMTIGAAGIGGSAGTTGPSIGCAIGAVARGITCGIWGDAWFWAAAEPANASAPTSAANSRFHIEVRMSGHLSMTKGYRFRRGY